MKILQSKIARGAMLLAALSALGGCGGAAVQNQNPQPSKPLESPVLPGGQISDPLVSPVQQARDANTPVDRGVLPPTEGAAGAPAAANEEKGEAVVESVEIVVLESAPPQFRAVVKGALGDSCTRLGEIKQRRDGNTLFVTVTTLRPAGRMCAQVIKPFEETVNLDTTGMATDQFDVVANGVKQSFALTKRNTQQPDELPQAAKNALEQLAKESNVAASDIKIVSIDKVDWTDSCLGLGGANESCLQAITPGFIVKLNVKDVEFKYHTNADGTIIRKAPR
jgi:hypothetical protein